MGAESIILQLFEIGAFKFGSFTLKSGQQSPIYIDLRLTISKPKLLVEIAEALWEAASNTSFDLLCGVPYTALPFATAMSIAHTMPMVLRRKEKKEYGTGRFIEGIYSHGHRCLIVEDVITSGKSILETVEPLQHEGLLVKEAVVLVDREQGGRKHLAEKGIRLHAVCTITSIVKTLLQKKKIDEQTADETLRFIQESQLF